MEATSRESTLPQSRKHYFRPRPLCLLQILFLCPGNDDWWTLYSRIQKATVLICQSSLLNTLPVGTLVETMEQEETRLKGRWHLPISCSSPVFLYLWKPQGPRQPEELQLFEWYCSLHLLLVVSYFWPFREGREETMKGIVSMGKARKPPLRKHRRPILTTDSCALNTKLET